jgi:hypothetical protein
MALVEGRKPCDAMDLVLTNFYRKQQCLSLDFSQGPSFDDQMNQRTAYLAKQVIEITLADGRVSNFDTNFAWMWRRHQYILKGQWLSRCICYRRCIFIHKPPNIDHNVAGWAVWMPTILSARDQGAVERERAQSGTFALDHLAHS